MPAYRHWGERRDCKRLEQPTSLIDNMGFLLAAQVSHQWPPSGRRLHQCKENGLLPLLCPRKCSNFGGTLRQEPVQHTNKPGPGVCATWHGCLFDWTSFAAKFTAVISRKLSICHHCYLLIPLLLPACWYTLPSKFSVVTFREPLFNAHGEPDMASSDSIAV